MNEATKKRMNEAFEKERRGNKKERWGRVKKEGWDIGDLP